MTIRELEKKLNKGELDGERFLDCEKVNIDIEYEKTDEPHIEYWQYCANDYWIDHYIDYIIKYVEYRRLNIETQEDLDNIDEDDFADYVNCEMYDDCIDDAYEDYRYAKYMGRI